MKKFSRCVLILLLVAIVSGAAGFLYFNQAITPMYSSTTRLYVVPGTENEASLRAKDGGLNDDFMIIFKSSVVISAAQKKAGTSEDIAQYLTVTSPADSNIIEITCTNPDQNTAKTYVDAVATTAIKTTSIIPVTSIQILSEGTTMGVPAKPDLYKNTLKIVAIAVAVSLFIEVIVLLFCASFKNKEDNYDDELEYEKKFGKYARPEMDANSVALESKPVPFRVESSSVSGSNAVSNTEAENNFLDDIDDLAEFESMEASDLLYGDTLVKPDMLEKAGIADEEVAVSKEIEEEIISDEQNADNVSKEVEVETSNKKYGKSSARIFGRIHK